MVASLELLRDEDWCCCTVSQPQACPVLRPPPLLCTPLGSRSRHPAPAPGPALTTPQPGQELPFSQARRRDCTPIPQWLLHLLQEPQDAQKMGTGQGVFSLQNLTGRGGGVVTLGNGHPFPYERSLRLRDWENRVHWTTWRIQATF